MTRSDRPPGWATARKRALGAVVPLLAITALGGACSRSGSAGVGSATEPGLSFVPATEAVVCNGTEQLAGHIEGASAGEAIELASSLPVELEDGVADADGRYPVTWSCRPPEARLRWDLTATGRQSDRSVTFVISGADRHPDEMAPLVVSLDTDGVACDGARHVVGTVSGAEVDEQFSFASDQTSDLHSGQADGLGELAIGWSCRPADVGRTWEVTVTGEQTGRTASFTIRGAAATDQPPVEITVLEDPFICNGRSRPFATVSNLVVGELVSFTAAGADDLRDGRAGPDGDLTLNWQCGPDDIGRTWELTATGAESGRTATVVFTGAADPSGPSEPPSLVATTIEDPMMCDGARRPVAELAGLAAGEFVDFTSPQAQSLREGRADEAGEVTVHWQCEAGELGPGGTKVWEVTATGRETSRSATFSITGTTP